MKIDMPRMLLRLRNELVEGPTYPRERSAPLVERLAIKGFRLAVATPLMMQLSNRLGRIAQWPLVRRGRITRLPPPLSGWTRYRSLPGLSSSTFRSRWRKVLSRNPDSDGG